MNYGDLDGIYRFYAKLRPLKLKGKANLIKYDNLATLQKIFQNNPPSAFIQSYTDIISKYAETDDKGKIVRDNNNNPKIAVDKLPEYNKEMNELLNEQCEVSFKSIKLSDIFDALDKQPDYDLGWDDSVILFFEQKGLIER
jgi:hypothetical protein